MYLGIEIGGTKLQVGLGAGDGVLTGLWRETVDVAAGPEGIRSQIRRAIPELLARSEMDRKVLKRIGIGFGGPVDDATQTIIKSHQIAGWDNFPLAKWISDAAGLPAVLGNDADVAGLAEACFGAGKGMSPVFYITIGSGIGGGLVINGQIQRGSGKGAAEIGHLRIWDDAPMGEIARGYRPLEDMASGWAIARAARFLAERGDIAHSDLMRLVDGRPELLTAQHVGLAAENGNRLAMQVLQCAWTCLAEAICQVITLLCPRRIVIGGGVSLIGQRMLFEPLRKLVAERVFRPFADNYEIVPALLGEEVVVHGALAFARKSSE